MDFISAFQLFNSRRLFWPSRSIAARLTPLVESAFAHLFFGRKSEQFDGLPDEIKRAGDGDKILTHCLLPGGVEGRKFSNMSIRIRASANLREAMRFCAALTVDGNQQNVPGQGSENFTHRGPVFITEDAQNQCRL